MGDISVEISEESCDAAQLLKSKAMQAVAESMIQLKCVCISLSIKIGFLNVIYQWWLSDNLKEAIDHLTEAILLYPSSAILYAARGISYLLNLSFATF